MPLNFENLKNLSIKNCNKNSLTDIREIKTDINKSKTEKLFDYISQVKNPYFFRLGDLAVKVTFQECGKSLQEMFESLILENLGK